MSRGTVIGAHWTECFTAIPIWLASLAASVIKYLMFRAVEGII